MSKAKTRATPGPQTRTNAGRTRDSAGRFVKGVSGNPGGTKRLSPEMREFAREHSLKGMKTLAKMLDKDSASDRDKIAIVRLFLEYGYGRPAAELDRERLDLDRSRLEIERKRAEAAEKQDAVPIQIEWDGAEDLAE